MSVTVRSPSFTVTVACGSAASWAPVYAAGVITSPPTESTGRDVTPWAYAGTENPARPVTEAARAAVSTTGVHLRTAVTSIAIPRPVSRAVRVKARKSSLS